MNNLDQFKRSINIWKITEGEYIDIYVDMYLWMNEIFKDLMEFTIDDYSLSTFYGTSIDNILIEENLKNDWNCINYKVYSVFKTKYSSYISGYQDSMSIFQEYLVSTLHLKGSRTYLLTNDVEGSLGSTLHLKGSRTTNDGNIALGDVIHPK